MSPAPKDELPESIVFQQFAGLNNLVAAERLLPTELSRAENIDIDDRGHIRRRRGITKVATGVFHSLFTAEDGTVYVVRDQILSRVLPSMDVVSLNYVVGDSPLSYVQVGDRVYFTSATASGVIRPDDTIDPWGSVAEAGQWVSPVVNPSDTLHEVYGRLMGPPPMATQAGYHNGRIYLGAGTTLWATQLYLYHLVDRTRNFTQFEAPITMIRSVPSGLYVGTTQATYFLSGPYAEHRRTQVLRCGVVPGSVVDLPGDGVVPERLGGAASQMRPAIMFLTPEGVCVGYDSGACYNVTDAQMAFPEAQRAAAMFRQQDGVSQYVMVADTGGTPTSTARIGDYVDAEIRRSPGA